MATAETEMEELPRASTPSTLTARPANSSDGVNLSLRDGELAKTGEIEVEAAATTGEMMAASTTRTRDFGFLPIPERLQWNPEKLPHFGVVMQLIFAFSSAFSVANIYYAQPILIVLAQDFNVTYAQTTNIPTLLQASYAVGLVFVCPLGDLVHRRQLLLTVVFLETVLTLILALVHNIIAFQIVSAFIGASSVAGQILIPLAADLSPDHLRARAIATVLSGILLGILLARFLSGLIAEAGTVSDVFWMAFALQTTVWVTLWATVPDYPPKTPDSTYPKILFSMAKYAVTEPLLIQGCLASGCCSAIFTCFWVTSTFVLGDIFRYNSLEIGLFGLLGAVGVMSAPFVGRLIDNMVPWVGAIIGFTIVLIAQIVWTTTAGLSIASMIVVVLALDIGMQLQQVGITSAVFAISADGRSRLSAIFIFINFIGQLIGTSAGSRIYLEHGGYHASGGFCVGLVCLAIIVHLSRGPHCPTTRWFGWEGGAQFRKKKPVQEVDVEAGGVQGKI